MAVKDQDGRHSSHVENLFWTVLSQVKRPIDSKLD